MVNCSPREPVELQFLIFKITIVLSVKSMNHAQSNSKAIKAVHFNISDRTFMNKAKLQQFADVSIVWLI